MADNKRSRRSFSDDGGPQEEGDRVKTKPVSCSIVGGKGVPVKRTSQLLTHEDEDESSDQPAPSKASKIGFSMSSKMATKSNPISIKLGASKPKEPVPSAPPKKLVLASVFDEDDDSEPEEISEDEDESSDQPAPSKASKIGFSMSSKMATKSNPISIKLGASKPKEPVPSAPPKKLGLASVFDEDDSEPEEMPPEAKMRMKNIGRETPTSAGPNSFNKGKQGFSDNQKLWERKIKTQPENS